MHRTAVNQSQLNYRVAFVARPGVDGQPRSDCFSFEKCATTKISHLDKNVLVKTLFLSVDPALRSRMNETTGVTFRTPWEIGETVRGLGGVGVVVESSSDRFAAGDIVTAMVGWPWQLYFSAEEYQITKTKTLPAGFSPSLFLSCFGHTGLTSLIGLKEKGNIKPGNNQTLVVSGAAGGCGSLAGQIGRLLGCANVVGICGTDQKCKFLKEELDFDAAINYKTQNVGTALAKSCPQGIDVYFDNVGGEISDEVFKKMNNSSHVVLCGQISQYNKNVSYRPPLSTDMQEWLAAKNITRDIFLAYVDYKHKFPAAMDQLEGWVYSGKLKVKESIIDGLDKAGEAFVGMMRGENIGKQLVRVSHSPIIDPYPSNTIIVNHIVP